ncbi:MAG: hypothetical protein J0L72_04620 [Armatimonadetes bacterium]|nr:hypothetical protein [Armatimonadota bacterium]
MKSCCGHKPEGKGPKAWEGWFLGVLAILVISGSIIKSVVAQTQPAKVDVSRQN